MMGRRWLRRPKDSEAKMTQATIATASVKAQASSLAADLRATLDRLDAALRELPEDTRREELERHGGH